MPVFGTGHLGATVPVQSCCSVGFLSLKRKESVKPSFVEHLLELSEGACFSISAFSDLKVCH